MRQKTQLIKRSLIAALALTATVAQAREELRIVGSSTVYPFASTVAERFANASDFKSPVVESTGSGGGIRLFCAGVGEEHPDIVNASRRIKPSEYKKCVENDAKDITEVTIGYDGIVLANATTAEPFALSREDLFKALGATVEIEGQLVPNPYKKWSEINSTLPEVDIVVYGPPTTSGTRDAFEEIALEGGCRASSIIKALKETDKDKYKEVCHTIREDGPYKESGENDNVIINKLLSDSTALGIFGYSYLEENASRVHGALIEGVEPEFENIVDGAYPLARSLFFYVKNAHKGVVPGLEEYVEEFVSERAFGEDGYLVDRGLIPLPEEERAAVRAKSIAFEPFVEKTLAE